MVTTPSTSSEAITLAVQGSRALAAAGQSDMVSGHASVRDPEGRGAWLKCSGWGFEEIDRGKIVLVSPDGEVLDGTGRRHIEYPIHTEIMALRGDVGAVVHTHSDAANAFSALDVPLRPLSHAGSLFCYPDVPRFTLTGGLISTRELGQALAEALGSAPACLMPAARAGRDGQGPPGRRDDSGPARPGLPDPARRHGGLPLARWGSEEDTVAKRAVVWSDGQLQAGWEYLVRSAG